MPPAFVNVPPAYRAPPRAAGRTATTLTPKNSPTYVLVAVLVSVLFFVARYLTDKYSANLDAAGDQPAARECPIGFCLRGIGQAAERGQGREHAVGRHLERGAATVRTAIGRRSVQIAITALDQRSLRTVAVGTVEGD